MCIYIHKTNGSHLSLLSKRQIQKKYIITTSAHNISLYVRIIAYIHIFLYTANIAKLNIKNHLYKYLLKNI